MLIIWLFKLALANTDCIMNPSCNAPSNKCMKNELRSAVTNGLFLSYCDTIQGDGSACCTPEQLSLINRGSEEIVSNIYDLGTCEKILFKVLCDVYCSVNQNQFMIMDNSSGKTLIIHEDDIFNKLHSVCKSSTNRFLDGDQITSRVTNVAELLNSGLISISNYTAKTRNSYGKPYSIDITHYNNDAMEEQLKERLTKAKQQAALELGAIEGFPVFPTIIFYFLTAISIVGFFCYILICSHKVCGTLRNEVKEQGDRKKMSRKEQLQICRKRISKLRTFPTFIKSVITFLFALFTLCLCGVVPVAQIDLTTKQVERHKSPVEQIYQYYAKTFEGNHFVTILLNKRDDDDSILTLDNVRIVQRIDKEFNDRYEIADRYVSYKDFCQQDNVAAECYSRHVLKYLDRSELIMLPFQNREEQIMKKVNACVSDMTGQCKYRETPIYSDTVSGRYNDTVASFILLYKMKVKDSPEYVAWIRQIKIQLDKLRDELNADILYMFEELESEQIQTTIYGDLKILTITALVAVLYFTICLLSKCRNIVRVVLICPIALVIIAATSLATSTGIYLLAIDPQIPALALFYSGFCSIWLAALLLSAMVNAVDFVCSNYIFHILTLACFIGIPFVGIRSVSLLTICLTGWHMCAFKICEMWKLTWVGQFFGCIQQTPQHHVNREKTMRLNIFKKFISLTCSLILIVLVLISAFLCSFNFRFDYDNDQLVDGHLSVTPKFLQTSREQNLLTTVEQIVFTECFNMSDANTKWLIWNADNKGSISDFLMYLSYKKLVFSKLFSNYLESFHKWNMNFNCRHAHILNKSMETFLITLRNKESQVNAESCPTYASGVANTLQIAQSGVKAFILNGLTADMVTLPDVVRQYKRATLLAKLLSKSLTQSKTPSCPSEIPSVFAYQHIHRLADQFLGIEKAFATLLLVPGLLTLLISLFLDTIETRDCLILSTSVASNMLMIGGLIAFTNAAVNPLTIASFPMIILVITSVHFDLWHRKQKSDELKLSNSRAFLYIYKKPIFGDLVPLSMLAVALSLMKTALLRKLSQMLIISLLSTAATLILTLPHLTF